MLVPKWSQTKILHSILVSNWPLSLAAVCVCEFDTLRDRYLPEDRYFYWCVQVHLVNPEISTQVATRIA